MSVHRICEFDPFRTKKFADADRQTQTDRQTDADGKTDIEAQIVVWMGCICKKSVDMIVCNSFITISTLGGEKLLLSKEMQARDEAQLPPTEAEAASGQPAGQYLNPPKQRIFSSAWLGSWPFSVSS